MDDIYSEYGLVLNAPAKPDRCDYDDDAWPEIMATYTDQLCASRRLTTRQQLDDWLAGDLT